MHPAARRRKTTGILTQLGEMTVREKPVIPLPITNGRVAASTFLGTGLNRKPKTREIDVRTTLKMKPWIAPDNPATKKRPRKKDRKTIERKIKGKRIAREKKAASKGARERAASALRTLMSDRGRRK